MSMVKDGEEIMSGRICMLFLAAMVLGGCSTAIDHAASIGSYAGPRSKPVALRHETSPEESEKLIRELLMAGKTHHRQAVRDIEGR